MGVETAHHKDFQNWLVLASEVEFLFGPMVNESGFHRALKKNINRGTAYCVRKDNGPPGSAIKGGLLFSPKPPQYVIGWLAVAQKWRRQGVGQLLVNHVLHLVKPPAEIIVTTFGVDVAAGRPAREFYEEMGFQAAELTSPGPEGGSRQIYRQMRR